jgi:hypothetical protein
VVVRLPVLSCGAGVHVVLPLVLPDVCLSVPRWSSCTAYRIGVSYLFSQLTHQGLAGSIAGTWCSCCSRPLMPVMPRPQLIACHQLQNAPTSSRQCWR